MTSPASGPLQGESAGELQRRAAVERREQFKDRSERFNREVAAANSDEERQRLHDEFAEERRKYREEDVANGLRPNGTGVMGRQVMWLSWIDIAVRHELQALAASATGGQSSSALGDEFSSALVAVTASAYTIESLYGELKYLIPSQKLDGKGNKNDQYKVVRNALVVAFGLDDRTRQRLSTPLKNLFTRRNFAVHPYSDLAPLVPHPSGVLSTVELSRFNAATSSEAVDCALEVLAIAAAASKPANRWVERWASEHASAHVDYIEPLRAKRPRR